MTYTFSPSDLIPQVAGTTPGTITAVDVLIDVEGTADLTKITVNGTAQVPAVPMSKDQCKNGGWKDFTVPAFKNQGDCVSYVATGGRNPGNG